MPITVARAIGFDPWLFETERTVSRTARYFVTPASSVGEGNRNRELEHRASHPMNAYLIDPNPAGP